MPAEPAEEKDFCSGQFARRYQYWIEHQANEGLVRNIRQMIPGDALVLDAGCGDGTLSVALAEIAGRVLGVDLSREMLLLAKEKAKAADLVTVDFVQADLLDLTLKEHSFDLVICNYVLHHTPVATTIARLARLVKPTGWLFLQEPACPVSRKLRPIWYRWQGLRVAASALWSHGLSTALKVGFFHQGNDWIGHQLEDDHWPQETWREVVESSLPGAIFKSSSDGSSVTILWKNEPDKTLIFDTTKPKFTRTRVKERYPYPPPADYCPFPRAALAGSVVDRFEEQVNRHADRTALISNSCTQTYADLNSSANRLARRLIPLKAFGKNPVAVLMDQEDPVIPTILGVLKSGRPYVAINPLDNAQHKQRVVTKACADTIITTSARINELQELKATGSQIVIWEDLASESDANPGLRLKPETMSALFFTSGSTGEPKGVARDHLQFLHSTWLNTNTYFVSPSDNQSLLYFPGFTASVPSIYDTLLNGATLCSLIPSKTSPMDLFSWLKGHAITHLATPAGLWRELIVALNGPAQLPALRLVTIAGQTLYATDLSEFQDTFGHHTVLLYVLAMTEAGAVTQAYIDDTVDVGQGPVPVGYPLPDRKLEIVDEQGQPLPAGEIGNVWITSPYLSLGYWNEPDKTAEVFFTAADDSGNRTFRTSDRGCIHLDGCVEFFGRTDTIIKLRGYRIDTEAIESCLATVAGVSQVAVVPRQRSYGDPYLVAYLTSAAKSPPTSQSLRDHISRNLPHFMIPDRFVWLEKMVLTSSGKIDRQSLARLSTPRPLQGEAFISPRNETEAILVEIWEELLEISTIGVRDSFVDLGGDSLLAMRMAQIVERRLAVKLPQEFFNKSTIEELAKLLSIGKQSQFSNEVMAHQAGLSSENATDSSKIHKKNKPLKLYNPIKTSRRILRTGPILGNHALPFSAGVRLHRVMTRRTWLMKRMYAKNLVWLSKWQKELGDLNETEALLIHLMANTWTRWRAVALAQSGMFDRGVWMSGDDKSFLTSSDNKHGTVLLVPHTGWIMSALEHFVQLSGRLTACVFIDLSIDSSGGSTTWEAQQVKSRSSQLWRAQQVLKKGGVVMIAGDGRQGNQSVDIFMHGRRRPFQTGGAWLAVMNNAQYVPVFARYTTEGVLEIELSPPLVPEQSSCEDQIIELTRKYGLLYAKRWSEFYPSVDWVHLDYNFNLPRISTPEA